jgi:uncharacterized protein YeaO (DUF488 family)
MARIRLFLNVLGKEIMVLKVKRIYEPADEKDGNRLLVDRLWPRGVSKEKAQITLWAKELTPSDELRKWVHADKEKRWEEFAKKYAKELTENKAEIKKIISGIKGPVTLVTAVKEIEHSHVPTLVSFLKKITGK